jgi:hypothetical protein
MFGTLGAQNFYPCVATSLEVFNKLIQASALQCGLVYHINEAYHFNSFDRTVDIEVIASSPNTYFTSGWVVIGAEHIKADIDLPTPMVRLYEGTTQMLLTPQQCDAWDSQPINEAFSYVELYVLSPNTNYELLKIALTDDSVTFRWTYVQNMQNGQFGDYNATTDTFIPY